MFGVHFRHGKAFVGVIQCGQLSKSVMTPSVMSLLQALVWRQIKVSSVDKLNIMSALAGTTL